MYEDLEPLLTKHVTNLFTNSVRVMKHISFHLALHKLIGLPTEYVTRKATLYFIMDYRRCDCSPLFYGGPSFFYLISYSYNVLVCSRLKGSKFIRTYNGSISYSRLPNVYLNIEGTDNLLKDYLYSLLFHYKWKKSNIAFCYNPLLAL